MSAPPPLRQNTHSGTVGGPVETPAPTPRDYMSFYMQYTSFSIALQGLFFRIDRGIQA